MMVTLQEQILLKTTKLMHWVISLGLVFRWLQRLCTLTGLKECGYLHYYTKGVVMQVKRLATLSRMCHKTSAHLFICITAFSF